MLMHDSGMECNEIPWEQRNLKEAMESLYTMTIVTLNFIT